MENFAKLLGSFFRRDFLYVMAGSTVVFALIMSLNGNEVPNFPDFVWFALAFLSYFIGYLAQEGFAVIGWVCIRDVSPPGKVFNYLNERVSKLPIDSLQELTQEQLHHLNQEYWKKKSTLDDRLSDQIERFLVLRNISTTFGPCLIISPIIYLIISSVKRQILPDLTVVVAVLAMIVVGVLLGLQSYYRATQISLIEASIPELKKILDT